MIRRLPRRAAQLVMAGLLTEAAWFLGYLIGGLLCPLIDTAGSALTLN